MDEVSCTSQVLLAEFAVLRPGIAPDALTPAEAARVEGELGARPPGTGDAAWAAEVAEALALAGYYKAVHALHPGQSALCLSGGGIRSAAFSLGMLQALARRRMLSQFDYLSTVSGGGYIGAWLTAWAHRQPGGFARVEEQLAERAPHAPDEPAPFLWLRKNQKFLTPRLGTLSADLWANAALFVRDLVLNWLVYVPAILASLLLPRALELTLAWWAAYARGAGSLFGWLMTGAEGAAPGWKGWTDLAAAVLVLAGMATSTYHRTAEAGSDLDDAGFRRWVLAPLLLGGLVVTMFCTVVLLSGGRPDGTLLLLWALGGPATFVAARLVAAGCRWVRGHAHAAANLGWEVLFLAVSGVAVGLLVWTGMLVRFNVVGQGTVRDLAVFGVPYLLLAFVAGQVVYAALSCQLPFGRRDQEWLGRASGHYLLAAFVWAALGSLTLYGAQLHQALVGVLLISAGAGTLTLATAVSSVSKATAALASARRTVPVGVLTQAAMLVFLFSGAVALSGIVNVVIQSITGIDLVAAGDRLMAELTEMLRYDPLPTPGLAPAYAGLRADCRAAMLLAWGAVAGFALVSVLMSLLVDVNQFSLHALYRNRLVRTFLGASNLGSIIGAVPPRSKLDGFSPTDDVAMAALWRDGAGAVRREGPFPVIGIALNLVGTKDPAWQERKAAPFVATPLHLGAHMLGYRDQRGTRGVTLGTAMAISGAAASPNWGYHSSALVGFVMMLFNVRLGWWLPNPKRVGSWGWIPRNIRLFQQEAWGRTTAENSHVYLSDGGHFDNLGLYEMLRRRCRLIVVVDATQDEAFTLSDLGRTLRTAAVDLGVTVTMTADKLHRRTDPLGQGLYAAMGEIHYPEQGGAGPATLIYVKPGLFADAPVDIRAYAAANAQFPHDSTINQWFTESQFESYRALGAHVGAALCGAPGPGSGRVPLPALKMRVRGYLRPAG